MHLRWQMLLKSHWEAEHQILLPQKLVSSKSSYHIWLAETTFWILKGLLIPNQPQSHKIENPSSGYCKKLIKRHHRWKLNKCFYSRHFKCRHPNRKTILYYTRTIMFSKTRFWNRWISIRLLLRRTKNELHTVKETI